MDSKLKMHLLTFDEPTENGNLYPEMVFRKALVDFWRTEKPVLIEHLLPSHRGRFFARPLVLENVVGVMTELDIIDGVLVGNPTLFDDRKPLFNLLLHNIKPKGMAEGEFNEDGIYVISKYTLECFSIVRKQPTQ